MADAQTLQSQFYLKVDGMDETGTLELTADLLEITVESSLHLPDVATVILHDTRLRWVDEAKLEPGKGLKVSAKPADGREEELFDGEIVELEPDFASGAQRLVVRAFDRLHRLGRGRYVRSFLNVTDGDLVQKIAAELGLRAQVGATSQVHPYVFQNNQTNLEFLQGRAAALGYLLFMHGKTLHFEPPEAEGDPIPLQWNQTLLEFRPRMTTLDQVTDSTVRGWDPDKKQEILGQVRDGNGTPAVGETRKAGRVAQSAFGMEAPLLTADRPIRSQAAADRLAQAAADRRSSRFIEAEGSCTGNSKIVAGAEVKVEAVGDRFSGTYLVTSARHEYRAEGDYTSHFAVSGRQAQTLISLLAPEPAAVPTAGLVIGLVTDNDDPEKLGRVKVMYPWLSPDHASHWARVVSAGAGADRGIEFLPEINDEVLVGFELGDIHHPYVLGGLWNGQDKPPGDPGKVVSGGKVEQRIIRSRKGHTITLDDSDAGDGIKIEDHKGNVLALDTTSNALQIKVQGDTTLECTGSFSVKAQGQVKIEGMGVQVDGGPGTVDVTGTMINLN
jgi:phage protein D